jgi:hypothetical protein
MARPYQLPLAPAPDEWPPEKPVSGIGLGLDGAGEIPSVDDQTPVDAAVAAVSLGVEWVRVFRYEQFRQESSTSTNPPWVYVAARTVRLTVLLVLARQLGQREYRVKKAP